MTIDLLELRRRLGGEVYDGGRRWLGPGPGHSKQDRSLSVWLGEKGRVLVHSFAGDRFGDCLDHLRIRREGARADVGALTQMRQQRQAEVGRRRTAVLAFCERIWTETANIRGTLAEDYLASRGVLPGEDLRFHASAPHSYQGRGAAPAMVALVRGVTGAPTGLHVTHLRLDGSKARRTMFGQIRGAAVRLAPAGSGLAVAEGLETSLSFAKLSGIPTWAALSAPNLAAFEPPTSIRILTVAADNDDSGAGLDAAHQLARRLRSRCSVTVRQAPTGIDWNDVVRSLEK